MREAALARPACQMSLAQMWLPAAIQLARASRQLQQVTLPQAIVQLARLRSHFSPASAHLSDRCLMPARLDQQACPTH